MRDFRQRRLSKGALARTALYTLGVLVLLVLAVGAVRAAWGMYGKFAAANEAQTQAQSELALLESQYSQVEAQVKALSTPLGQEAQLRARYGVAKAGEGEIDIIRQAPSSTQSGTGGEPWWQQLWHAISVW